MNESYKRKNDASGIFLTACISVLSVLLICLFLFSSGIPAIHKIGLGNFLFGTVWRPANNLFGIFPMIVGSLYVTAGALIVGVPVGVLTAVFMSSFVLKSSTDHSRRLLTSWQEFHRLFMVSLVWLF